MRSLRLLLAFGFVLVASTHVQGENLLPHLDVSVEDSPSISLLALQDGDPEQALPHLDAGGPGVGTSDVVEAFHGTSGSNETDNAVIESILMALDVIPPAGTTACNRGDGRIKVLFGISDCLPLVSVLVATLNTAFALTANVNVGFFDDSLIERVFRFGTYRDTACSVPLLNAIIPPTTASLLQPFTETDKTYDLYVNIRYNGGQSFTASLPTYNFKAATTLEVCVGTTCPNNLDFVTSAVSLIGGLTNIVTNMMFCKSTEILPTLYHSDLSTKKQCSCVCPILGMINVNNVCQCSGGKSLILGICKCPGNQLVDANGVCGCPPGRVPDSSYNCVCSGGRVPAGFDCVCPAGSKLENNVCVADCFWKGTSATTGYICEWGASKATKDALKLNEDCLVNSPVPKDNYVADRRINKNDPSSPASLGAPTVDPMVKIAAQKTGATTGVTKMTTWLNYVLAPKNLEDEIKFSSFGVFDLSLEATDYRSNAKCLGCIAIKDTYPPTPKTECAPNGDTRATLKDFSTAELNTIIAAEDAFTGFYSPANVQNNGVPSPEGDNVRSDVKLRVRRDFFATSDSTSTDVDPKCFTTSFVSDLLSAASGGVAAVANLVKDPTCHSTSLVCQRCCYKSITLQENYRNYECGVTNPPWGTRSASTGRCEFGRCLKMQPRDLATASTAITTAAAEKTRLTLAALPADTTLDLEANVLHRSFTCTGFGQGCKVEPKMGELFTKQALWNALAGVSGSFNPADYVYWRYKSGSAGVWKDWNDGDTLTFEDELTIISIQAWTRCGLVNEFAYKMKLHPHSTRDVCNNFGQRWVDNSPTPRKVDGNMCAYPRSDFALLTFQFDSQDNVAHQASTVKGKYTDIKCYATVTWEGGLAGATRARIPIPMPASGDRIQLAKQFALELIRDPTTAKNTDVKLSCDFRFEHFDNPLVETDTCALELRLTDCDAPAVFGYSTDAVCRPYECGSPTGPPSLFEACGGDVFTTVSAGATVGTQLKSVSSTCCDKCSIKLQCVAFPGSTSLTRCEPPAGGPTWLMALAMDDEAEVASAVEQQKQSSMMTTLVGASALVAVVALVAVKMRASTARAKQQSVDDAYVSLLD